MPNDRESFARGVSSDGNVIVGMSRHVNGDLEAFRWTEHAGMVGLGALPYDVPLSFANDVSDDGITVVGASLSHSVPFEGGKTEAFRYTDVEGITGLGFGVSPDHLDLIGSEAIAVSDDGSIIAGHSDNVTQVETNLVRRAWIWREEVGILTDIGNLDLHDRTRVWDMNSDGTVLVGMSQADGVDANPVPFIWTQDSGIHALEGSADRGFRGYSRLAVSDDRSTVVGGEINSFPFIWDVQNGMRGFREFLVSEKGLETQISGWTDLVPRDISGDGRRIAGGGINPDGNPEAWIVILEPALIPGDADQDFDFDQLDLVKVQVGAKYLTGEPATWGEGDWNVAADGYRFAPATGDGVFDQLDIVAAQVAGIYLTGSYEAAQPDGHAGDGQTSVGYDARTGELWVDAPAGIELTSVNIDSAASIFTGDPAQELGGSFDNDADNNIFKATFGGSFGSLSFGNVAQTGLSEEFLLGDLSVIGSLAGGGALGEVDLIYVPVPEPSTVMLLLIALCLSLIGTRRDYLVTTPFPRSS